MAATVKISPRIGTEVARRLRLAASVRSRSMSAVVNDVLDKTLPSLEEIRDQLTGPAAAVPPAAGPAREAAEGGVAGERGR